jgi:hypothetical protein
MLSKILFFENRGGVIILLLTALLAYFPTKLTGQSMCPDVRFEFEIEKVLPTSPWKVNSNINLPGAFHAFYRVKLKTKAGQPSFPASFTFNYLQFDGLIKVNNFTSRINRDLTIQYSQTPYLQYLDINPNSLENGEIIWKVGSENSCEPGGIGNGVQVPLPAGTTSVTLFTICVEAVAGDLIKWTDFNAFNEQCSPTSMCQGPMSIVATGGTTNIVYPAPSPGQPTKRLIYEYAYDSGLSQPFVRVSIAPPLAASGHFAKVDGSIHIVPEMATANLDLVPAYLLGGPTLTRSERRKNADGSFDIYFSFEDFPHPDSLGLDPSDTLSILAIKLEGIYNISQGGILHCSLNAGRWVSGALVNNFTTYQLISTPTDIDIPGNEPCNNDLKITGTTYQTNNDCASGIRFTLTHDKPTAMSLQLLKLQLVYDPIAANGATPGTPVTNLPDATNSGSFTIAPGNSAWIYNYEKHGTVNDPVLIENGMFVTVPFDINVNCVRYLVTIGEADPTPGAGNGNSYCALEVELGDPLCDPEIVGNVVLPNEGTAPYYRVLLKDIDSPYDDEENNFCESLFSFCPDQDFAPFYLQIETNSVFEDDLLCVNAENTGVTTYDLVLIQKHLRGGNPFTSAFQRFASDANGQDGITVDDIIELRKLILGDYDNTDNDPSNDWVGAPSWRYFRKSISYPTWPDSPMYRGLIPILPSGKADTSHVPINGLGNYGRFYAVKLGDINYTCNCNNLRPISEAEKSAVSFRVPAMEVRSSNNTVLVPVYSDAPFDLTAIQGGFRFDPGLLELSAIIPNPELPVFAHHFGQSKASQGELRFGWSVDQNLIPLPGKALLFTLQFQKKPGVSLPQGPVIWASDNIMQSLAYPEEDKEYPVRLDWEGKGRDHQPLLGLVVSPNPFEESLTAFIYAEKNLQANILLSDNRGRVYDQRSLSLVAGDNIIQMQSVASAQPGVYFLTLEADGQRLQRRVVKLK